MTLSPEKIKEFRRIGHRLKPVVIVSGNELSPGVAQELSRALEDHELIKVKISCADRDLKSQLIAQLCEELACDLVQKIGNIALIYRPARKVKAKLSNLQRFGSK